MSEFVKENFTVHPKFHPRMVVCFLETMVPRVELEDVSAACANVRAIPVNVRNLVLSVDAFNYHLLALEGTTGLEVGVGLAL